MTCSWPILVCGRVGWLGYYFGGYSLRAIIKILNSLCTIKKIRAPTQPLTHFCLDLQTIAVQIRHVDCWSDSF